ncbi:MAG: hypothetical protein RIQ88_250 [Actinomycetota bacterium]|jgi:hypothetical protein
MKLSTKKLIALLASALLSTVGITAASAPAQAAACPYAVADPTSNDHPKTNIRLVSPVLTDDNSVHRVGLETQFSEDCDWFGVGVRFNQVYVPHTMKTTLTFRATDMAGNPLVNTRVKLRVNKGYSGSLAKVKVNGVTARPAPSNAADGADVYGTTDLNGNVSFIVILPYVSADDNGCIAYGGTLPAAPASLSADTPHDVTNDATQDCYTQLLPEILGEKTDSADFVELHYFDASSLTETPGAKSITMLAPALNETNSISQDGFLQTYAPIAAKQVLAFQALNEDGTWARNVPVTVRINKSGSSSNAKISAGIFGNGLNGASTTLTNSAAGELTLTGTSDAFGIVTFQFNNTDTAGEAQPATRTSAVPGSGAKFSRVSVEVDGEESTGNAAEFHFYKPITVAIAASGKKINVTIANAIGKSTSISITGKARATVRPTKASQVYSYTVTAGVKTITVVSGLTTVTKKITIK